jgi:hypothetical protein
VNNATLFDNCVMLSLPDELTFKLVDIIINQIEEEKHEN